MKKLPVGIENFKRIIDDEFYYIDKSGLIEDVLDEQMALFTRPRRFGKTLNMSMLYYFFSNAEKENAYLFDRLEISKNAEATKHQNQYPVIFITLKDLKNNTFEKQVMMFNLLIQNLTLKFEELFKSEQLEQFQIDKLNKYKYGLANEIELQNALQFLTLCLKQHYQKNVIILIDEYDVPLQNAYENGYYDEMVNFLRNVFSSALKTNDALEKGILTGCLRISKESIFTGLNNFKTYSVMDYKSSSYFGFTQDEVTQFLKDYQLEEFQEEVKEWYDGYLFGNTEIYNPWSTLMFVDRKLQSKDLKALSFWSNTSSNSLVLDYIKNADRKMQEEFETLMQGKSITKRIKQELTYQEMDDSNNVYSFLLLTGYLKVVKEVAYSTYELVIPNREVYEIYNQSFMDYFKDYVHVRKDDFIQALLDEKVEIAQKILSDILFKRISYYDNNESFYHGLLIGLLDNYGCESNREVGEGRADIIIYPDSFSEKAIVFECKHSNDELEMVKDSQDGADQIVERKYKEGIIARGYIGAVGYGISFYKKKCKFTLAK